MSPSTRPRLGCNTLDPLLTVTRGEDYDLIITRRALEMIAAAGFEAVEYSHALHWSDEEIATVREMTADYGLVAWSLHAWVGGDVLTAEGRAQTLSYLTRAGQVALGLGVERVVHHANGASLEGEGERRLEAEAETIAAAWQPGYRFALECMKTVAQMEYTVALVDRLGPERAGVCVDTGHAHLGDLGAARAVRMAGSRLITTHLQDNHGQSDEHLPPGDGTIPWDEVGQALREIGYTGCLLLELTDQPSPERRLQGVRGEVQRGAEIARRLHRLRQEPAQGN